jgi:RNA polymerase sporulation-specific sigma factor
LDHRNPWDVAIEHWGLAVACARAVGARAERACDVSDLVQEGLIALRRAAILHDPARGYPFPLYASRLLKYAMWGALSRYGRWTRRSSPLDDDLDPPAPAPAEALDDDERALILAAVDRLDGRERTIVVERYGLDGRPPRTNLEVGIGLGLTEARIRQVEKSALAHLADHLNGAHR